MREIQRIKCGNGNCYIVKDNDKAILVDTARTKHRERILAECREAKVQAIILTHTHIDHCENAAYLAKKLGIPIAIHKADEELIQDNMLQSLEAKSIMGKLVLALSLETFRIDKISKFEPQIYLKDGDNLSEFGINAQIIELPGHTNGSIGIDLGEDGILVGDALMNMFYPTVSMLYHNREQMLQSAKKISTLGDKMVYFGHGKPKQNRHWVK